MQTFFNNVEKDASQRENVAEILSTRTTVASGMFFPVVFDKFGRDPLMSSSYATHWECTAFSWFAWSKVRPYHANGLTGGYENVLGFDVPVNKFFPVNVI